MVSIDSISFIWLASEARMTLKIVAQTKLTARQKLKLMSNWYEPKINNLQRQSKKDQ